ncbi:hypothetical protein DL991_10070 [Amycolatopsis sp. WAC 01375]|nr:hypothetical protein DL991_10070 [Amycolatopsis sp. WAC 01375]
MTTGRKKRPTSAEIGLDVAVRDKLRAVVFDANCFGYGRPDLDLLTSFAGHLARIGIAAWIPEPVAWEWAEHLAQDWTTAATAVSTPNRRLKKAHLGRFQTEFVDKDAVAAAFLDQLAAVPNVEVIALSPEHALAGLKDQVLQLPPAKRKGPEDERVKTGASDSAWLREVLARVGNASEQLLFVTEDHDITDALTAWKHTTALLCTRRNLLPTLFTVKVDSGDAAGIVLRHVAERLPAEQGTGLLDLGAVGDLAQAVMPHLPPDVDRVDSVALTRIIGVAGIFSVLVEEDDAGAAAALDATALESEDSGPAQAGRRDDQVGRETPHLAVATLMLLAEARATTVTELHHQQHLTDTRTVPELLLRADVFVDLSAGKVVDIQPDSTIALHPGDAYDDDRDALSSVVEELRDVIPGLEFPDGWPFDDDGDFQREINSHTVDVEYRADDAGEWSIQVTIDDAKTAELSCWYDVGSRVWDGREGFDMPGAYPIRTDIADSPNPIWAFSWWIIRQVYGRPAAE